MPQARTALSGSVRIRSVCAAMQVVRLWLRQLWPTLCAISLTAGSGLVCRPPDGFKETDSGVE